MTENDTFSALPKQRWRIHPAMLAALACMAQTSTSGGAADNIKLQAYGRHLASECTSCHRLDGIDNGIPSIVGWPTDTFVATMGYYRKAARTNPVMVSVAGSLNDQQVEALAAFFGSLPKPPPKSGAPTGNKVKK